MTLTDRGSCYFNDGQRGLNLTRSQVLAHSTFLHSWRTTATDMWRMHVNGNAGANRSRRIRSPLTGVGDSRERDSVVSMYLCRLQVKRIMRIGAISGRSRWPVARVRLHEHEQPDCRRESPRTHWFLMLFWCHSLLSSSLFRLRKYIHVC